MRAIDVQGFAGAFAVGAVQSGFTLVGKRELPGGFAVPSMEANRHVLGDGWRTEVGQDHEWTPLAAEFVFGNPPCSGFSSHSTLAYRKGTASGAKEDRQVFRGVDSPINACMWSFARYVTRVRPYVAAFESVPAAGKLGLPLMRDLHAMVVARTGLPYALFHVFHNDASVGGCAMRPRYFWVVARVPFGIEPPEQRRVATVYDAIGDLQGFDVTWDPQPYRYGPTWWAADKRSASGLVDGHATFDAAYVKRVTRLLELMAERGLEWPEGKTFVDALKIYYDAEGSVPENVAPAHRIQKHLRKDWWSDPYESIRWRANRAARVVAGGFLQHVHPWEPRTFTFREAARIQGFPDDFTLAPYADGGGSNTWLGKGIPVTTGRWISTWARHAIEGMPGKWMGEPIGPDEFKIDVTRDFRAVYNERTGAVGDHRNAAQRRAMEERHVV